MVYVGWAVLALAALMFLTGCAGFINPKLLPDHKTGEVHSRSKWFLLAWFGPVLPLVIGITLLVSSNDDEPASAANPAVASVPVVASSPVAASAAAKAADRLDFDVTPAQWRNRYNKLLAAKFPDKRKALSLPQPSITAGSSHDSFKHMFPGGTTYVIGVVSKSSGKVNDVMIGIGGDGTSASAARAMMITVLLSVSATGLPADEGVTDAVIGLLGDAATQLDKPEKMPAARLLGDYKFNAVGLPGTGILFSISRVE